MNIKPLYLLLGISIVLALVVMGVAVMFLLRDTNSQTLTDQALLPTTDPSGATQFDYHEHDQPEPNPEYLKLITEQPYRNMLPHYDETFLVEYKQSTDTIVVTTIDPGNVQYRTQLMNGYREQARAWLGKNGANLDELNIEYKPDIN